MGSDKVLSTRNVNILFAAYMAVYGGRFFCMPLLTRYLNCMNFCHENGTFDCPADESKIPSLAKWEIAFGINCFYISYGFGAFFLSFLAQYLSTKKAIVLTNFGIGIGFITQGLSTSFWMFVIFRCFAGMWAGVQCLHQLYLSQATAGDVSTLSSLSSTLQARTGIIFAIGPLIGHACYEFGRWFFASEMAGFRFTHMFAGGMNFLIGLVALFYLEESEEKIIEIQEDARMSPQKTSHVSFPIWVILAFSFLSHVATSPSLTLAVLLHDGKHEGFEFNQLQASFIFPSLGLGFLAIQFFFPMMKRKLRSLWDILLISTTILTPIAVLCMPLVTEVTPKTWPKPLLVALVSLSPLFIGLAEGLFRTVGNIIICELTPPHLVKHVLAGFTFCYCLGILTSVGIGRIADHIGSIMKVLYWMSALGAFNVLLVWSGRSPYKKEKSKVNDECTPKEVEITCAE